MVLPSLLRGNGRAHSGPRPILFLIHVLCLLAILAALLAGVGRAQVPGDPAKQPDPTAAEVPLPAAAGWHAFLLHTADSGVWSTQALQVRPEFACPEVIACDDKGRVVVLVSYSGKWTPQLAVHDGQWLAALGHGDVDPAVPGKELYAGGKGGNLHQLVPRPKGRFDSREIWNVRDDEIHTVVAADLRPARPGDELWLFTMSGRFFEVRVDDGVADATERPRLSGRVRDAVLLRHASNGAPTVLTVSRSGELAALRADGDGVAMTVLAREPMGLGRVALSADGRAAYVTRDDGLILRFALDGASADAGGPRREIVYAGPQGPRGLVAGRFDADPAVETLAVFGYSKKVQLLKRRAGEPWHVETIFTDVDAGHWLGKGELDGRNATDEILCSGYSGRVVMLARPPGHGLDGVRTDPHPMPRPTAPTPASGDRKPVVQAGPRGTAARPWRVAGKVGEIALTELSTLRYQGGFESKTLVYETLVRRDASGRIVPALAESWRILDGGLHVEFTLRSDARFHDGTPVTAAAVVEHFRRFVGLPEHDWLRSNTCIREVIAVDPRTVAFRLDRKVALLADLCAINPCGVRAPASLDREGNFVAAVGSGPFRFVGVTEDGHALRYERAGTDPVVVDLVRLGANDTPDDPLAAVLRGDADLAVSSWMIRIDPARAHALRARGDGDLRVVDGPGSSTTYLSFRGEGATADVDVRRALAAAIDRAALVRDVEHGFADPTTAWAAPSVAVWPRGPGIAKPSRSVTRAQPLRLLVDAGTCALGEALVAQWRAAGLAVEIVALPAGTVRGAGARRDYDLRIEVTHGLPYDPYTTLVSRCTPAGERATAESPRFFGVDPSVVAAVEALVATTDPEAQPAAFARVQQQLDAVAQFVPLYAKRRIAIVPSGIANFRFADDMYRIDLSFLTSGS